MGRKEGERKRGLWRREKKSNYRKRGGEEKGRK